MKELKVIAPEGYEIDKEKSTFETIVFKEIEKKLPMKWEELGKVKGYYISSGSSLSINMGSTRPDNKNIFPSEKEAKAMLAMAQLCQLRDAWNGDYKADWEDASKPKHCISVNGNTLLRELLFTINRPIHFKSAELRDKFLETFKDLLEEAKPFL